MTTNETGSPIGYPTVTPYLIVQHAARALEFYKQAFNATEVVRLVDPHKKVGHAEIRVGNSPIMLADEFPDEGYRSPQSIGGSPVSMMLYVEDVDARFAQALDAGATVVMPVQDQFDGDRRGTLIDPFGHTWSIATRKEDVSPDEMQQRYAALRQPNGTA